MLSTLSAGMVLTTRSAVNRRWPARLPARPAPLHSGAQPGCAVGHTQRYENSSTHAFLPDKTRPSARPVSFTVERHHCQHGCAGHAGGRHLERAAAAEEDGSAAHGRGAAAHGARAVLRRASLAAVARCGEALLPIDLQPVQRAGPVVAPCRSRKQGGTAWLPWRAQGQASAWWQGKWVWWAAPPEAQSNTDNTN